MSDLPERLILDELKCIPELQRYVLINLFNNVEQIVTKPQLEQAFGNDLGKIMSNRSSAWTVVEYFDEN